MRRTIITALIAALIAGAVFAAVTGAVPSRMHGSWVHASGEPVKREHRTAPTMQRLGSSPAGFRANCYSLRCINRKLNALYTGVYRCERTIGIAQFYGYLFTRDGVTAAPDTGLDYTTSGGDRVLIDVC
jgi:hypothetical protein